MSCGFALTLWSWSRTVGSYPCTVGPGRRRRRPGLLVPVVSQSLCGVLGVLVVAPHGPVAPAVTSCGPALALWSWSRTVGSCPHVVVLVSHRVVLPSCRGPGLVSWSWSHAVVLVSHCGVWPSCRVVLPSHRGPGLAPWGSTLASCGPSLALWGPALALCGPIHPLCLLLRMVVVAERKPTHHLTYLRCCNHTRTEIETLLIYVSLCHQLTHLIPSKMTPFNIMTSLGLRRYAACGYMFILSIKPFIFILHLIV
jgi:hypothetical protein